jgi:UV DNA damage endonuclease
MPQDANGDQHEQETRGLRLGFAVKVLGEPGLKSNDARRWQQQPHLRVSLEYLEAIFAYLARTGITMYRLSSDLAPYITHPDLPQFHNQIAECAAKLRALGAQAKARGLRLSLHPSQYVVMNAPDREVVDKAVWDLERQVEILDAMELGLQAVVVIHVGGVYGDKVSGRRRWIETYARLSSSVRRRLVLENDDIRYSAADVLAIHAETGVPLILDYLHFWCNNPEELDLPETAARFMATWPTGVRPKIHFSSPRTEMRAIQRKNRQTGKPETLMQPPVWRGHADYVNPFEFITFLRANPTMAADVMLETKAKDLALLRLRRDLARYAPDVAARFGIAPDIGAPDHAREETEMVE